MAIVKNLVVDVDSSQFARKLKAAAESFVFVHLGSPQMRIGREAWRFEIWIIRELMEDIWDRTVVNHYGRSDPVYVAFKQHMRDVWPDNEVDFSFCFWSAGIRSHHFDIEIVVEYTRFDVIVISLNHHATNS